MNRLDYKARLIDKKLDLYLSTFGAVCVEGPKWCGKTWTCTMHSKSEFMVGSPSGNFANRQLANLDVNRALEGKSPHLIDEWQEVPSIWDAVRASVDEKNEPGRYLLTGSRLRSVRAFCIPEPVGSRDSRCIRCRCRNADARNVPFR